MPQTKPGPEQLLHDAVNPVVFHELHQASRALREGDYGLVPVLVNPVRSQVLPSQVVGFTGNLADLRRVEGLLDRRNPIVRKCWIWSVVSIEITLHLLRGVALRSVSASPDLVPHYPANSWSISAW